MDSVTSDGGVVLLADGSVYSVDSADQATASSWSSGDPISVANTDDRLTNLSTGDNVAVTSAGHSSDTNIYPNIGDHTLSVRSDDGKILILEDGSIWIVAPPGDVTDITWLAPSSITVNEGSAGPPYELVNTDDQSSVLANYIGTP